MFLNLLLHLHRIQDKNTEVVEKIGSNSPFEGPWFYNMDILSNTDAVNNGNFSINFPKGPSSRRYLMSSVMGFSIWTQNHGGTKENSLKSTINHARLHLFLAKITQNRVEKGLVPILEHRSKQGLVVDLQDLFQRLTFDTTCMDWKREETPERLENPRSYYNEYISMKQEELSKGITKFENNAMGLKCDHKFLRDTILNFMIAGRATAKPIGRIQYQRRTPISCSRKVG
ncbi:hypothetical protein PVL29_027053 [Vitis rotundifolia]|uniref:Uncharacterized protein n=1 Tax=Vitis rotundifolia TaxID=103349 RepID=A0AA38YI57_VITRO|nr:hypothetical protein PVL29_027053 [Vitis rotundifolia]